MLSADVIVPVNPQGLSGQELMDAWREHADEIAAIEHVNISDRTPEDTGTLDASLTESLNPDAQTIMQVYTDPDVQLSGPWNRVYAQYQEGPPLGHTTYTTGERQYIYDAVTEDLGDIQAWANRTARDATSAMTAAAQGTP